MEEDDIKVSIICTVYNHEKFLRKCLEGFAMQKTNFKFEVLVHDDASTDKSAEIIKEYEKKYPEIVKPIYQKENQHSKGVKISKDILLPQAKGKYIAFCEGDDFWTDENKLQKQFNVMENNPEYALCVHNTIIHDLLGEKKNKLFNDWQNNYILTEKDVIFGWSVHTSSYFFKKEALEYTYKIKQYWFGDYIRLTMAFDYGKIIYLNDVMSQYNYNNLDGVTYLNKNQGIIKKIKKENQRIEYLKEFNNKTNGKYEKIINERIIQIIEYNLFLRDRNVKSKEEFYQIKEELKNIRDYRVYIEKQNTLNKIKLILKNEKYFIAKSLRLIKNRLEKNKKESE